MKLIYKGKKLFIALMAAIIAMILFVSVPFIALKANESDGISREIKEYKYEKNDIFYSDGYFAHSATEYDPHLATLSILMAKFSMNPGGPDDLNDTKWYNEQSNRVKGYLETIGFDGFKANEDYKSRTGFSTIGVATAKKQVGDYTVISVAVRSGGYFLEWANNVYLGDGTKSDYMHEGWYNASQKLLTHLRDYIKDYHINGKVKLWMAGFSRGGAVTNIAAGLIDNEINNKLFISENITLSHDDLYAYTFEAPQGANINSKTVKDPKDAIYNNIWNVVNPNDLVTKVAMASFGFTRFGNDKFITTKGYDPQGFEENRKIFKSVYSRSYDDVNKYSGDNFEMRGVTGDKIAGILAGGIVAGPVGAALTGYLISKISGLTSVDTTKGNYDPNIVETILLEEICNKVGSRKAYCVVYQELFKDVMLTIMSDNKNDMALRLNTFINSILLETVLSAVGMNGLNIFKKIYPDYGSVTLANVGALVLLLAKVYVERPNEIITLAMNFSNIFQNHDTDYNVAHIECQDSYYIDKYNAKNDNKLKVVNLRESAELVHMSFYGYNDLQVYDGKNQVVNIDGHVFGKSDVKKCDPTFAAGYYSYVTEEKMELFMPVNKEYKVSFKSYSKKIYHTLNYKTLCLYSGASSKKQNLPSGSDWAWFNSDRVTKMISVKP